MDFTFTEEQRMIQKMAREFAEKEVAPYAAEIDRKGEFPHSIVKKMFENGFFGLIFPEEFGGAGADSICGALVIEELSKACPSVAVTLNTNWLGQTDLLFFGTEEQKKKYLPQAINGKLMAFALTEPSAGTDAAGIRATAVLEGDHWVLNGTKAFVTNGGVADILIIAAKTDKTKGTKGITSFIVEKGTPGLSVGKEEEKMGVRGSNTTELILKDCRVPKENMLGKEGEGFKICMIGLDSARMYISALALGLAESALETSAKYAKERHAFGQPIGNFQGVQYMIANMAIGIEATRMMLYNVANMIDRGVRCTKEAAILKLFSSEMAVSAAKDAIQILGGYGYTKDYAPERLLRDAKYLEIADGTSEILRMVIGRTVINS